MSECKILKTCVFFNSTLAKKPGISQMYKNNYCFKDYDQCARYMVAEVIGEENIPADLYPQMVNKVEETIARYNSQT